MAEFRRAAMRCGTTSMSRRWQHPENATDAVVASTELRSSRKRFAYCIFEREHTHIHKQPQDVGESYGTKSHGYVAYCLLLALLANNVSRQTGTTPSKRSSAAWLGNPASRPASSWTEQPAQFSRRAGRSTRSRRRNRETRQRRPHSPTTLPQRRRARRRASKSLRK